jgi:AAA15 family ATPase/GTPase
VEKQIFKIQKNACGKSSFLSSFLIFLGVVKAH